MVSPRENVSIASPSEHPPPPRTHSSLPQEVWSIARPRASYSREPGSSNPTKFSEVWAVASRNSLYRILETSVALGTRQRAKSSSQAPIYVPGWGREGKIATVNFREFPFHALQCIRAKRRPELRFPDRLTPLVGGHNGGHECPSCTAPTRRPHRARPQDP